MAPRKKKSVKKVSVAQALLKRYHDPKAKGSLGGIQRFAKAWGVPLKVAQNLLKRDLAYTLHKPRRRRFPTVPVVVGGLDDQWVADLVEVQYLAKYNRGIRYLLTVVDVLSKFAWVHPFFFFHFLLRSYEAQLCYNMILITLITTGINSCVSCYHI